MSNRGMVAGEPGDLKGSRRVREGGVGKGPQGTSPTSYLGRRSSPGVRGGASRDSRDMAKARLPDIPIPRRHEGQSAGKTPETGAMLCGGIVEGSPQPP